MISLKLFIDLKAQKVLFAVAYKPAVDFIYHIRSSPEGEPPVGTLGNVPYMVMDDLTVKSISDYGDDIWKELKVKLISDYGDDIWKEVYDRRNNLDFLEKRVVHIGTETSKLLKKTFLEKPKTVLTDVFLQMKVEEHEYRNEQIILKTFKHFYVDVVKEDWKLETIFDLFESCANTQSVIIFVNNREKADWLADKMRTKDYTVSTIDENMDQSTRDTVMREFQSGSSSVLIATDELVACDGNVVQQQVSLVINYDFPTQIEKYFYRIGRSGRYGSNGVAINFVTWEDDRMLYDTLKFYDVLIQELPENWKTVFEEGFDWVNYYSYSRYHVLLRILG